MKQLGIGIIAGLIIALLVYSLSTKDRVYVGPLMHTAEGGRYHCIFESKDVFEEYMMETD